MKEDSENSGGKQVIARAAAVLRVLGEDTGGQSLGQIAKATSLPRTTVHRIVTALEAQGLAITGNSGVRLGPALVKLAASVHADVVGVARPFIEALGRRTRETVDLCAYRGQHAVLVDQYMSDQELRVVSTVGTAYPVHCTAPGKALLAGMSDEQLALLFEAPLERRTEYSFTEPAKLRAELTRILRDGVAIDHQEHALGVCALSVTLEVESRERYALALAVPCLRLAEREASYRAALLQCKAEIEAALGAN